MEDSRKVRDFHSSFVDLVFGTEQLIGTEFMALAKRINAKLPRLARSRRGTTAIETAMVMPMFIFFLYMVLEVSHMLVVNAAVKNAARTAARQGTTSVSTTAEVTQFAKNFCSAIAPEDSINVVIKDASVFDEGGDLSDPAVRAAMPNLTLEDAEEQTLFMVEVSIQYDDILFIPWPFTQNVMMEGRAFMRRE